METKHRPYLRRLILSYWPAEGFTISLTTGHHRFLDAEVIAQVPTPLGIEAEYKDARLEVARIYKALRKYTPRLQWDDVDYHR